MRADDVDLSRDRRLVEAWQAGDATAFDDLYRRYFDRLKAFCQRRVGSPAVAEELAQDAFVKALQALPRFSGERHFYPWMTVIAGRLCIDHHRRNSRVEPTDQVDLGTVDDGLDARFALQADLENLDRALRRLGPRDTEVLDLRERRGLSYDEIADVLGVPHSTVETRLFRARRALRREFHAVSLDRLAAIPGVGWLAGRMLRARDRLSAVGPEMTTFGTALAAGAVTAVLVALPTPNTSPHRPTDGPVPMSAAAAVVVTVPPAAAPGAPVAATSSPAPASAPPEHAGPRWLAPPLRPMTADAAAGEAAAMPLHVDLDQLGAGVDLTPLLARLTTTSPTGGTQP